jgi:hypothetical protein
MTEYPLRFMVGGFVVSAFAILGESRYRATVGGLFLGLPPSFAPALR